MMKKSSFFVFGLLTILLTLVGCGNGSTGGGTAFTLTEVITVVNSDSPTWAPVTSFPKGEDICFGIRGRALDKDISTYIFSSKEGGTESYHEEIDATILTGYNQDGTFTHYIGGYFPTTNVAAGTYSVDVYAVDAKGNQSNTKRVTISITEN